MRIAMLGTRGVPAHYGGFETCVEEVGKRLVIAGHDLIVYCRKSASAVSDSALPTHYLGMQLVHLPAVRTKAAETLSHTALSVADLMARRVDVAFVFNAANAPFLPLLRIRRIPFATHVDGLEWKRAKWKGTGRRYYRVAEALAVRWSDALIADADGIAEYYEASFGAATELISYGAPILKDVESDRLAEFRLFPRGYHLVVARFEPENHIAEIVDGYVRSRATLPLVVVGSAPYSDAYAARVHGMADERVRLLGGVWDQHLLNQLYGNAVTYIHGHSVGGTNPSLLRAIGAGSSVIAFDVSFNREVLGSAGAYFADAASLEALVEQAEADPNANDVMRLLALDRSKAYDWDDVAAKYEDLCTRLATRSAGRRPSGRRRKY